jgi:cysteine desulfurase
MKAAIYLDHNATAPVRRAVIETMAVAASRVGNPASVHRFGRAARELVEEARGQLARLIGATPSQVIFTSGGTEANNLALAGFCGPQVMVSAIEHESVLAPAGDAERLPVGGDGVIDLEALASRLEEGGEGALVSIMLANNETGVLQPVGEAVRLARRAGAFFHCDAAQAVGKLAVDFHALGVDAMTVSAHKFGGPQGIGALIVDKRFPLHPRQLGGGQERRRRAGTENVAAIAGFGKACELAGAELADFAQTAALRDRFEAQIREIAPQARIFGGAAPRLPNTSCLTMPGVGAEVQVMALDLAGFAVSAGSACSSGSVEPSHVLAAMGVEQQIAGCGIRVSLGRASTEAEIDGLVAAWRDLFARASRPHGALSAA